MSHMFEQCETVSEILVLSVAVLDIPRTSAIPPTSLGSSGPLLLVYDFTSGEFLSGIHSGPTVGPHFVTGS